MNEENKPISVSQYIEILNSQLRKISASITGEISEAKLHTSGHLYFNLKDEENESVLQCVIWRSNYEACGIDLEVGMKIIAVGHADIWPKSGRLTFKAGAIELVGEGIIKKRYDALKKKLTEEGLFDLSRKKPIPEYPQKIGVITSKTGAVIHDFLNNLGKFGFKVKFIDARVEGPEAVPSLLKAIEAFRKISVDVLVIMRGGGSIEALQAFDNEKLVREIVKFPAPVIAGIGHHQDVSLVALAADAMESTPTATANLLGKSWESAKWKLNQYRQQTIDTYANILRRASDLIMHVEQIIKANDPKRNLKLGYAIVRSGGKIIKGISFVKLKDVLDLEVVDGIINTEVKNIKKYAK